MAGEWRKTKNEREDEDIEKVGEEERKKKPQRFDRDEIKLRWKEDERFYIG